MGDQTDEELLPALRRGDEVFFTVLYRRRQGGSLGSDRGTVRSWLSAVAWRQEGLPEDEVEMAVDPREDLEHADQREQLRARIPGLPAVFREVLVLCVVEEMSYAEAARIAEVPEGTIRSRLHRAKALLAERMAPAVRRES